MLGRMVGLAFKVAFTEFLPEISYVTLEKNTVEVEANCVRQEV